MNLWFWNTLSWLVVAYQPYVGIEEKFHCVTQQYIKDEEKKKRASDSFLQLLCAVLIFRYICRLSNFCKAHFFLSKQKALRTQCMHVGALFVFCCCLAEGLVVCIIFARMCVNAKKILTIQKEKTLKTTYLGWGRFEQTEWLTHLFPRFFLLFFSFVHFDSSLSSALFDAYFKFFSLLPFTVHKVMKRIFKIWMCLNAANKGFHRFSVTLF